MINLLPPDITQAYRYAHHNLRLLRWVVAFSFGFIGLGAVSTAGLIYLHQTEQNYVQQIATAKASLASQHQTAVEAQINDISNSLKLAVQVLSKEVLFSKLLTQLATVTPDNAVLTGLNIIQSESGVDITAMTTDYTAATQLQVNLADPTNEIFSHADIVTITCGAQSGTTDPRYPCNVTIRALFAQNNPFLFINDGKVAK